MLKLNFSVGSLILTNVDDEVKELLVDYLVYDERLQVYRAEAYRYAQIVRRLHKKVDYEDEAKQYSKHNFILQSNLVARQHQQKAFDAWKKGRSSVVILPTGSGKSFLAMMIIAHIKRSTLIIVPTIDLMNQWQNQLESFFQQKIGMLGGGNKEILPITVSTYNSALIHMETIGNQFGLLICDECHHLPSERNQLIAKMSLAPFRLGLTATPERSDEGEEVLYALLGGMCFRQEIEEMCGGILADYEVIRLELDLDEDEQIVYEEQREIYKSFLRRHRVNFSSANGWGQFIIATARDKLYGKQAFQAFLTQKRLAASGRAKIRQIWQLIKKHKGARFIIFTTDNDTAYNIGKMFFLPVLTYQTKNDERAEFLDKFRSGEYPILVTSRVLNEGVDVPQVNIAIVVSGTGSVREHVQRLGRILRPQKNKKAILYELISKDTAEYYISERRRQHNAYQRPS